MLNQVDLDSLITSLRGELDQIEQAIHALEETALTRRAEAIVPERRAAAHRATESGKGQGWTRHRLRAS